MASTYKQKRKTELMQMHTALVNNWAFNEVIRRLANVVRDSKKGITLSESIKSAKTVKVFENVYYM